jgi:UDP-N-acetylglucosamine diphosphorylase / glucose-1-phosphate thymidylyltransferase / UDP-N-acetylgalactosamine diphosphorylase / glucosamine-1-phosphate N-acetyltransferase / galactosamine-1-phosphate N-acetyltransferase
MKCIMLAGGKGTRMLPLTEDMPKPLLTAGGVPLIEHIFALFPDEVTEFVVVLGHRGSQIRQCLGSSLYGRPVTYVTQEQPLGTFDALMAARHLIGDTERFFVVYGDDIHDKEAIAALLQHDQAVLVSEVNDPRAYGVIVTDTSGQIQEIQEKPEHPKSNLVSTGVLLLTAQVFEYAPAPGSKGEFVLADAVSAMSLEQPVMTVTSRFWFPVTTPEDLASLDAHLRHAGIGKKISSADLIAVLPRLFGLGRPNA